MEINEIKQKIQQSTLLSENEKKEWIFLLPRMSEEQKQELLSILSVKITEPKKPEPPAAKPPPSPVPKAEAVVPRVFPSVIDGSDIAPRREPKVEKEFSRPSVVPAKMETASQEKGGLSVQAMRQASSPYDFFDSLGASFAVAVKNRQKNPEEILADFQSSPLYQAYVEAGRQMLSGREPTGITRSEFEAIADFRSSLKKILHK